jgi:hypothetical protein
MGKLPNSSPQPTRSRDAVPAADPCALAGFNPTALKTYNMPRSLPIRGTHQSYTIDRGVLPARAPPRCLL